MSSFVWGLIACFSWGVCPILDKLGLLKFSPIIVIFIQSLTITLLSGAYIMWNNSIESISNQLNDSHLQIIFLITAAIVGGMVGEYAYLKSISKGNISTSVAISSCFPLITVLIAYLFVGELISVQALVGITMIVAGIILIS